MQDFTHLKRKQFLILAATTIGGTWMARAGKSDGGLGSVSLDDAHKGTLEIDLRIMNQYEMQPQEVLDFYVASRKALTGENPERDLAAVCRSSNRWKLGGPLLGDITSTSVAVWMHLPEPSRLEVNMTPEGGGSSKTFKSGGTERILSVPCDGLSPDTAYAYTVTDSQKRTLGEGSFTTPPAELSEKPFRIGFGGDFHKAGMYRPELLKLVQERGCRAMLLVGDSAVDGRKCDFGLINTDYMLRNLSPPMQELMAHVPVSATWDDHDYWGNDTSGRFTKGKQEIDADGLRRTWKTQWNNPERDVEREGIYFQTQIGPVHFIALDTRSCRLNEQRGKRNCYLGEEQMAWLKQQIEESSSPYILLSSGTMWSDNISQGKDSWGTWDTEGREEILQWIDAKQGSQVILLSGDRHGARCLAIPRPGNKKIYEFEVGTLGGCPGPKGYGDNEEEQLFGYPGRTWAIGEFTFTKDSSGPLAVFRLFDVNGQILETVDLAGR
jgi:alkaline phosphatase D